MGVLFEKGRSTITEHLQNIFETGELKEFSECRDFRHAAEDGKEYQKKFIHLKRDAALLHGYNSCHSSAVITRPKISSISRIINLT